MGRKAVGREKRKKGGHTAEDMRKGIRLHQSGLSLRKSAKECNLPYPTLRRYVLKHLGNSSCSLVPNYEVNCVFTVEQEQEFKSYIVECSQLFYGLTSKDVRKLAYETAKINSIKIPSSWVRDKMAGKDWLVAFKQRNPGISFKKPEACSLARATAFNKNNVQKFFDNLKNVLQRCPSFGNGSRIFNLDETSTTTVQRPQKVLAPTGKSVCKITSGERGILVTTCCIVNAIGHALPPAMVFPRKKFQEHMLHGSPSGTLGLAAPSGWMNSEIFVDVMKHFIQYSSATKDNPALLIMDNHESHLSIEAINLAKSSGVTILTLHPHTTAKMQPLDVGLHAPFKAFYNSAVDSWLMQNQGKNFTIYNVADCVGQAYLKAMTPMNIIKAFKKCGIHPFDDTIFTEIDFLPSSVTDRPQSQQQDDETDAEDEEPNNNCTFSGSPSILSPGETTTEVRILTPINDTLKQQMDLSTISDIQTSSTPTIFSPQMVRAPTTSFTVSDMQTPSTSTTFISPRVFRPHLKAGPRKGTKRKPGRSLIATDTPEKEAIEEKKKKVSKKEVKKTVKKVKQVLFKVKKPAKKDISKHDSDTSDSEEFVASGSSSGGENFISDDDKDILTNFSPLKRDPKEGEYVIVEFIAKSTKVYYVAKILEKLDDDEDDSDFFVSFLKLKSKVQQKFIDPIDMETAGVRAQDIKYILPSPQIEGTSRRKLTLKFPVDMSAINLRY